jgi:hypothetical protein
MKRSISLVLGAIVAGVVAFSFCQTGFNLYNAVLYRLPAVRFLKGSMNHIQPVQPDQINTDKLVYPGGWRSQTVIQEKCL